MKIYTATIFCFDDFKFVKFKSLNFLVDFVFFSTFINVLKATVLFLG